RLWDPLTGREKGQWHGHTVDVQTLAICPAGKIAVSGGQDRTLRLWDVAAGKELRRLAGAKEMIWSAAFSPDGRLLASASKAVRLWDVVTGQELRSLGGGTILQVGFSLDGKAVASVAPGEKTVRLWDVATGRELRQFANHMQHGPHFAFCPDGRTLATGDSAGPLHVWELATGEEIRTIGAPMKPDPRAAWALQPVAFSPDGRTLAAGYSDETVRLWEVASGQERARFHGHRNGVVSLAFSPDGSLLASGSWDRTVMIWDVKGQITARRPPSKLEITKLKVLWDDLGSADASKAYRAFQTLLGAPREVLPLLKQHLHPVAAADAKLVTRLVADLDSDQFDVREKATRGLRDMADLAELPLRTALAGAASPELRRRAETLLEDMGLGRSPTLLQNFRAIEVLEHIATPEARQLLQKLAGGAVEARLTREAKAACDRLAARR
ncbi:MAG TPA: WD40 repeat domain-containing protein, partial [Gemmataceae bacterium]|nr:WD40 repeat domain-containing protein [Gemmataceae bacterium]